MSIITYITPTFAVAGAMSAEDIAEASRLGFRAIISNRPDGEEPDQLLAREQARLAWANGLQFRHIPVTKVDVFADTVVDAMAEALDGLAGPILAHCMSGMRSAIVWGAASAQRLSASEIITTLAAAGFDLELLREDFEAQAERFALPPRQPASVQDAQCVELQSARAEPMSTAGLPSQDAA